MASQAIEVRGAKEVQISLSQLPRKLGKAVIKKAMTKAMNQTLLKQARANAPKDTGNLRKNIISRASKINNGRNGIFGRYLVLRAKGKAKTSWGPSAPKNPKNAFYGRFIHDGWNVRGACQRGTTYASGGRKFCVGTGRQGRRQTRQAKRTTLRGIRDISGNPFIEKAFITQRSRCVRYAIALMERGTDTLLRKERLK